MYLYIFKLKKNIFLFTSMRLIDTMHSPIFSKLTENNTTIATCKIVYSDVRT